jgi:nucleoside-diphosphate-sugar epimerase
MAKAIEWGIHREGSDGGHYLIVNAGSEQWNYQIKDLADEVAKVIPGVEISLNRNAQPDKRSYRVNFEKFFQLAPGFQPEVNLITAVSDLRDGLKTMGFQDHNFRNSKFVRFNTLKHLNESGYLTASLEWTKHARKLVRV